MKKITLLLMCILSTHTWAANCGNAPDAMAVDQCLSRQINTLKVRLNKIYQQVYTQTEAKVELNQAQKAWITYRDLQCGNFTTVDAGYSSATSTLTLDCQSTLLQQRIDYLKTLTQ